MAWIGAAIAGAVALGGALINNAAQKKENRRVAQFQHDANKELLKEQLAYDTPKNQMSRFREAGLNEHLIYGQGNPGNQGSPLKYPELKPAQMNMGVADAVQAFNQTRLAESQVQATNATVRQKTALTELNKMQTKVLEANPALNTEGFKAILDSLKSTAEIKASESRIMSNKAWQEEASGGHKVNTIYRELLLLEQKYKLGDIDQSIKGQVLQSKEFQNSILEIQKKFLEDGDVSPGQILQFIQMLLLKIM